MEVFLRHAPVSDGAIAAGMSSLTSEAHPMLKYAYGVGAVGLQHLLCPPPCTAAQGCSHPFCKNVAACSSLAHAWQTVYLCCNSLKMLPDLSGERGDKSSVVTLILLSFCSSKAWNKTCGTKFKPSCC